MKSNRKHYTLAEALEPRQLLAADVGPSARAIAPAIDQWISTYVFKVVVNGSGTAVDTSTMDDRDFVVTGPNGFARKARLHRIAGGADPSVQSAWYKISAPNGVWDASDNGIYSIRLNGGQIANVAGATSGSRTIGTFSARVAPYPSNTVGGVGAGGGSAGSNFGLTGLVNGVDARLFGAYPNDGIDDTAAIQRAIDSLPRDGDGVPDASTPAGGVVALLHGVYNTSAPLRLSPASTLRGQGAVTVIQNSSNDSSSGAIELTTYSSHGFNILAGVEDLSIVTAAAKGIRARGLTGDLIALRLKNLKLSTGGVSIDLRDVRTYNADIRNITIQNPGSSALWIGASRDWVSAVNRISNFTVTGNARAGFRPELGMVVLGGDVNVDGLNIANTGASVTPLYARGSLTLRGLTIANTTSAPSGVIARFDNCFAVDVERIDSLSSTRRIEIKNSRDVRVTTLGLAGGLLSAAVAVDSSSHLTVETLRTASSTTPSSDPRWFVNAVAAPDAGASWGPSDIAPSGPASGAVVNVSAFGAHPNDFIDDTDAIQRAIDSLPTSGTAAAGGLVLFTAGTFNTTRPIRLPSGVWLRGQGNGTTIHNVGTDRSRGVIEFSVAAGQVFNVGAGVEDLKIYSTSAAGIRADAGISSGLVDARLSDLVISAAGVGIDLSAVRAFHTTVEDIMISNPGGSALVLGDAAGYSADNRVIGLQLEGRARAGFNPEKALVELRGGYVFENGWIEHPIGARALPMYISGAATIRGSWLEFPAANMPDGNQILFENVSRADIDRIYHVLPIARIKLVNAQNVKVKFFNIDGMTSTLRENITVDENSRLELGLVNAQQDSGMLDHPRVKVLAAYNGRDALWLNNRSRTQGANLVRDPMFLSLMPNPAKDDKGGALEPLIPPEFAGGWRMFWGEGASVATGTVTVEQTATGPRLKIVVASNPTNRSVVLIGRLNVTLGDVGRKGVAHWRVDAPRQVLVYTSNYSSQYEARAMNGATAAETPAPLSSGDEVVFLLSNASGTYYISAVGVATS